MNWEAEDAGTNSQLGAESSESQQHPENLFPALAL